LFKKISDEAVDFLMKLLIKNPAKRMNVKQALQHQWIKKFSKNNISEFIKNSPRKSNFAIFTSIDEIKKLEI